MVDLAEDVEDLAGDVEDLVVDPEDSEAVDSGVSVSGALELASHL